MFLHLDIIYIYISYIQTCAYSPATLYPNCNAISALLLELCDFEQTTHKRTVTFLYIYIDTHATGCTHPQSRCLPLFYHVVLLVGSRAGGCGAVLALQLRASVCLAGYNGERAVLSKACLSVPSECGTRREHGHLPLMCLRVLYLLQDGVPWHSALQI
jgi:hypothetical protein